MVQSSNVVEKTVVGKTRGRYFSHHTLDNWEKEKWLETLKYISETRTLSKGWFVYKFEIKGDANLILQRYWSIDSKPIMFKE